MRRVLHTTADLARAGLVEPDAIAALEAVAARYAIAITPAVAAMIDPADPLDPIGLQYLPSPEELISAPGEQADANHPHHACRNSGVIARGFKPLLCCGHCEADCAACDVWRDALVE